MHYVLRVAGMFVTIVVQLPVGGGHTGGTLSVRHGDQEVCNVILYNTVLSYTFTTR
jgi:hypothetical protein